MFKGHVSEGFGWFRLFGYGLHWRDLRHHSLSVPEMLGHTRVLILGKWAFITLAPLRFGRWD